MLETGKLIVLFAIFLSFKMIFQFESILQALDLKGSFGKKIHITRLCIILCP